MGVFDEFTADAYKFHFQATLRVGMLVGGIPSDPDVIAGWLKTKLGMDKDDLLRDEVAKVMAERGLTATEAAEEVKRRKHLNGFKRTIGHPSLTDGQLFIEGRQVKAMIKEAASISVAGGRLSMRGWGKTNKSLLNFLAEHVFVPETEVGLQMEDPATGELVPVLEPSGINQRFVHTHFGNSVQYDEYVTDTYLSFIVVSDWDFSRSEWGQIWLTGELNGLGASRSQGYGTFETVQWDAVAPTPVRPGGLLQSIAAIPTPTAMPKRRGAARV